MREEDFRFRLLAASSASVSFASKLVKNQLSLNNRYHVILNMSCDHHAEKHEILYPEDNGKQFFDLSEEEVVNLLSRDGRVPQWIDISVVFTEKRITHIQLYCCGRYTDRIESLYYYESGTQPFGIKSPSLPHNYKESTKFKLPSRKTYLNRVKQYN